MKNFAKLILAIAIFHLPNSMHAQVAPSVEWQRCFGGSDFDQAFSIQQTNDNGYIVAGFSNCVDGDVTENIGFQDYWIVKLDMTGNIVWQKSLGGSNDDWANSIRQTADSGFIVAGYSYSNDNDVTVNNGNHDIWIAKLDISGSLVWQKSYGGPAGEEAYSIQQTTDGGYIVAGWSGSNSGDVSGNHGNIDSWIIKLDMDGNLEWQKSMGGSLGDYFWSVQQTTDGGFIVAGQTESNDFDVSGNHGDRDYWIVKLDTGGNLVWQECLGGDSVDRAYSVQQIADGGFIVAGYSNSNNENVSGNNGAFDYWIVKLDTVGNLIWQKSLGGSSGDAAYSIQQTADGGFVVGGYSLSNDGDITEALGNGDYWIVRLDASGNLVWQKSMGGSVDDLAYSLQLTNDGGFIVAGWSLSNNGDVSGNHGSFDYWVVKLSSDSATGISLLARNDISLYPNPVQSELTINLPTQANLSQIHIYDLQGRIIELPIAFISTQAHIKTTALPDGFYLVQIINENTGMISTAKFVKQQ